MFKKLTHTSLVLAALGAAPFAQAANPVKIGFITTLSTPAGYIGEDERDGFNLAVTQGGGKLGGIPVELVVEDDGLKPANAKQAVDRMLQSGIKLYTGVNFSNVLAAVVPSVLKADQVYVSLNPGPSNFAGEKCDKNYFVASYQNDAFHTAGGAAANELGYKRVVLMAPTTRRAATHSQVSSAPTRVRYSPRSTPSSTSPTSRWSSHACARWHPTRSTSSTRVARVSTSPSSTRMRAWEKLFRW